MEKGDYSVYYAAGISRWKGQTNMSKKKKKYSEKLQSTTAVMNIDEILSQLSSLADNSSHLIRGDPEQETLWKAGIKACNEASSILSALQIEGINDPEQVHDLIADYNTLAKQYQMLYSKFELKAKPEQFGDKYICPDCKRIVRGYHDCYCWFCGKHLDTNYSSSERKKKV